MPFWPSPCSSVLPGENQVGPGAPGYKIILHEKQAQFCDCHLHLNQHKPKVSPTSMATVLLATDPSCS